MTTTELKQMLNDWIDDGNSAPETVLEGVEPTYRKSYDENPEVYESGYLDGFERALRAVLGNL